MFKRFLPLAAIAAILALPLYLVHSVDPYQYFRASDRFFTDPRLSLPGLAKHQTYDSVVIGDTIACNLDAPLVNAIMPAAEADPRAPQASSGGFIKLAMDEASAYEESLLLDTALSTGQVRRVIWAVTPLAFSREPGTSGVGKALPLYLYGRPDFFKTVRYLASPSNFMTSFNMAFSPGKLDLTADLDKYSNWHQTALARNYYSPDSPMVAFHVQLWLERIIDVHGALNHGMLAKAVEKNKSGFEVMKNNVDAYLLPAVENNPEVEFMVYLPPFSIYSYKYEELVGGLDNVFRFRNYLAMQLIGRPNVKLFDFQGEPRLAMVLGFYKDTLSYAQDPVDISILKCMADGQYLVTDLNQLEYNNERLVAMVNSFQVSDVNAAVIERLQRFEEERGK